MQELMSEQELRDIVSAIEPEIEAIRGKTILITGGHGFLGRNFIQVSDLPDGV